MAFEIGQSVVIDIGTSSPATNNLEIADSLSIDWSPVIQDVTSIGDTTRKRLFTLLDYSTSISAKYDTAVTAVTQLETASRAGGNVFVRVLYDGTNGVELECTVDSFSTQLSPDGVHTFSCSLSCTGTVTTVS